MRTSESIRSGANATSADCARLWRTLTGEYISDLQVELVPQVVDGDQLVIRLQLVSAGLDPKDGSPCKNIWAARSFASQLNLISSGSLFDLLIVGYRQIDDYFRYGEPYAPPRLTV
jgi:hypothetical protein